MASQVIKFGSIMNTDSAATASALVERDSSGNIYGTGFYGSSVHNTGSDWKAFATKTGTYTLLTTDNIIFADASGGAFSVTTPPAATSTGIVYTIVNIGASGTVTVDGNASETINGSATLALSSQWSKTTIISNGTNWVVIG